MRSSRVALAIAACLVRVVFAPFAQAQRGWGGGGGWGGGWNDQRLDSRMARRGDPREGRVDVSRFVAPDSSTAALGHGAIAVTSAAATRNGDTPTGSFRDGGPLGARDYLPQGARAPFEAAVVDRLIAAGYDTVRPDPTGGQIAELRISREVLVPAEIKRNPVSGTAAMEVGTRGSAYGLGVNVDMTKPRTALLSTRMEARILDRATGKVLWEGRASIATREGDDNWGDTAIAGRLAQALFDDLKTPTKS